MRARRTTCWSFNSGTQTFDYLDDGESLELTYTVRATDDSLVSDDQTVTITINGTNDAPVITVGAGDSAAETLLETNAGLAVSDTLTVVDADLSDAVTASVQSVSTVGPTGGLTNGQLLAMLSVTLGSIAADAGAANNLAWSFNSGTQTFDYLDDGESLELTYTVRATDDSLVSDDQTVTITINGTDDRTAPTDIRLIVDSPLVDQSTMQFSISGTLVATDADPGSFTYTLLSQSPTGGSAATFSITDDNLFSGGNLGQLQTYRLAIEATQADDPAGMSYTEIFTIITGRNGPQGDSLSDPQFLLLVMTTSSSVGTETTSCSGVTATIRSSGTLAPTAHLEIPCREAPATIPCTEAAVSTRSTPEPATTWLPSMRPSDRAAIRHESPS